MTHTFRAYYFHLIWSTKERQKYILPEIQERLYPYLGGIIRKHNGHLLEIGGMPDHVHLLITMSNLDKFSEVIRDIKACSTAWIKREFPKLGHFSWQEGYGAFSVSYSQLEIVKEYIKSQAKHHSIHTYEEEYKKFLSKHEIKFDHRFVLG